MTTQNITTSIIAEINNEIELAQSHADTALNHASRAGALLITVKESLKHGEWLPWCAENLTVSERQARRYIQAAKGIPLPIRTISKRTHVSDLEQSHTENEVPKKDLKIALVSKSAAYSHPDWLPKGYDVAMVKLGENECELSGTDHFMIQRKCDDFYYVISMESGCLNFTQKAIRGDWVEYTLRSFLSGIYTIGRSFESFDWQYTESNEGFLFKTFISPFSSKKYEHLKAKNKAEVLS